jgi:hypothetical protein
VELQFHCAVELEAEGVIVAVTHWVPRSFQQEVVGNAGSSGAKAQTPCRNDRVIWEIWVYVNDPAGGRRNTKEYSGMRGLAIYTFAW